MKKVKPPEIDHKTIKEINLNEPFKFDGKVYWFADVKGKKVIELILDKGN